jgi:para-aminobenzoate synthetase component 1
VSVESAIVGGRRFSHLLDLTDDLAALDSTGIWVVVLPFSGRPVCARFAGVQPAELPCSSGWVGPERAGWRSSLDQADFEGAVAATRAGIAAGSVYQVNLCRILTAPLPFPRSDGYALAGLLAAGNPAPYSAVVDLPTIGLLIVSASPELFLRRRGRLVESAPIKGTAASADSFLAKDYAENVMIVDLVRNDLGRVCEYGSVTVPQLHQVERHPGLCHLVSRVSGRLRGGVGWPELIAATFPPGSVTGAPKMAALRYISLLEHADRGPYCGAIGWVDADRGEGELNVAIRTFWIDEGCLHFGTGGAVTWDSTASGEWAETELKARRLLDLASGHALSFAT